MDSFTPPQMFPAGPTKGMQSQNQNTIIPRSFESRSRKVSQISTTSSSEAFHSAQQSRVSSPIPPKNPSLDLIEYMPGFYRILDLISEQGSGGMVDKIIISQDQLGEFINTLVPGAYASSTKVDYKSLDQFSLKPVGVYGSKEELIRFLYSMGAINDEIAAQLSVPEKERRNSTPFLRSGLYLLRSVGEEVYVVYWSEDTTWNDNCISTVRRNRVTFMRYLNKICDQTFAFISSKHAKKIVWNEDTAEMDVDEDEEEGDSDRLFTFEVSKTNEQEEGVIVHPGFDLLLRAIRPAEYIADDIDPEVLKPRLVAGETAQAFLTVDQVGAARHVERWEEKEFNQLHLAARLRGSQNVHVSKSINNGSLRLLVNAGLRERFSRECGQWQNDQESVVRENSAAERDAVTKMEGTIKEQAKEVEEIVREEVLKRIIDYFPTFTREDLGYPSPARVQDDVVMGNTSNGTKNEDSGDVSMADNNAGRSAEKGKEKENNSPQAPDRFPGLVALYPKINDSFRTTLVDADDIRIKGFEENKRRLVLAALISERCSNMDSSELQIIMEKIVNKEKLQNKGFVSWLMGRDNTIDKGIVDEASSASSSMKDASFLSEFDDLVEREPILAPLIDDTVAAARTYLSASIKKWIAKLSHSVDTIKKEEAKKQIGREGTARAQEQERLVNERLIDRISEQNVADSKTAIYIDHVSQQSSRNYYGYHSHGTPSLIVSGHEESTTDATLKYTVHHLSLTAHDKHAMQLDPQFVPTPQVQQRFSNSFNLPRSWTVRFLQLFENDRLLLIVDDHAGSLCIFIEELLAMEGATHNRQRAKRSLHIDKIGADFVIAYDEQKRMLAICSSSKLHLHLLQVDERWSSIIAVGSTIDLKRFYIEATQFTCACFVAGNEEVLLVDKTGCGRVFSFITQQFRPASLQLPVVPSSVHTSPDGACVLVRFTPLEGGSTLRAYHWSTFGSNEGVSIDYAVSSEAEVTLTSMGSRSAVQLLILDKDRCRSISLEIQKKVTEFSFKERNSRTKVSGSATTFHNSLVDCHADVWTRFPVLPAIVRKAVTAASERRPPWLTFVADENHDMFAPHFSELISQFERATRKPTGEVLSAIRVHATAFETVSNSYKDLSRIRAGEWLVDLLCLIPIHIAIARDNRFVPLKDGVTSSELEKSLLGAEVGRIVDALSFGWYESIFGSYLATKPVKVVSSMGEQSVGKSFALNHLADTSFAGSAMRTTEGVWMSVTPTDDALVVALDFEGVHSIERSAQEDTLLVLFNTAISNLVLFRNNFALSRDLGGLFQSFQSSSTVLDPASNPDLFQSTLVIIIKDVVESDNIEIAREFSLKFGKIVQDEQDQNFITRLHGGHLDIVPWPVIESRKFYTLFPVLKKKLDKQPITHRSAGEFLFTLKTLLAKLKANDWGSMSQTLAAHRAQLLMTILPRALAFGVAETEPEEESLKNFDTDEVVPSNDTTEVLWSNVPDVSPGSTKASILATLLQTIKPHLPPRGSLPDSTWVAGVSAGLDELVERRVNHVSDWILSNLTRFKAGHASIEELRRAFENDVVELKGSVQLCKLSCASCHMLCTQERHHESAHDCGTNHSCAHVCEFTEEHPEDPQKPCGFPGGHDGPHICEVTIHLCGVSCALDEKRGCLAKCTKVVGHSEEDGHRCSAPLHGCGEPCMLRIRIPGQGLYECNGTCAVSCDDEHDEHVCENRLCPLPCQLCKRLCANQDHLHGLQDGQLHLCGQEHSCVALCASDGICEIETAPQSIQATFTGRHETFEYTKYSQVAKRLQCVIPITANDIAHQGPHIHTTDSDPFHFCEERCESCGYLCTLPRGHPQQEHETRHGSMSRTQWAVDGPDGTFLEVGGRKFSSNDEGAPMLCSLFCKSMGRHFHIDYCRTNPGDNCTGPQLEHCKSRLVPHPARAKDWITHGLYWQRTGFKDPYSREDQANFAKCDAMCSGPEHNATASTPAQPSYCTLPLFHPHHPANQLPAGGNGYVSHDGHLFACKNPTVLQQAFHVIFAIDRSGSMGLRDRLPLSGAQATATIARYSNNRLGAVLSSLHAFWLSRQAAVTAGQGSGAPARRDAYSVVLFDSEITTVATNDFTSNPDQLLALLLPHCARGGTNYTLAVAQVKALMTSHWSTERTPVVIFLSDGECTIADQIMQDLARSAVTRGKTLSFQAVSFGPQGSSQSLRRMAQIAREVEDNAPRDPLTPAAALVPSSYSEALDTVRLAETFLGFADSLRKTRGSLMV